MGDERARILVVDDDPSARDIVRRRLEMEGYTVVLAEDGWAAIAEVKRQRPDLIITDLMMPKMDGLGLVRRLRGQPETASLPIVMLTARDRAVDKGAGLDGGADDYIGKPFEFPELLARVKALLRRARGAWDGQIEPAKRGRLVAFIGAKGGSGTTTVAANVAAALARGGTSTILVELTAFQGTAPAVLGIAPRRRVDRLPLAHPEVLTTPMIEDTLLPHKSGLRLLAGPAGTKEDPPTSGVGALLDRLRTLADVVVADLDPTPAGFGGGALRVADEVWLVAEPEPTAVGRAAALIEAMERWGMRPARISLLVNQTSPEMTLGRSGILAATGRDVALAVPAMPKACADAARRGEPVVDTAPELPGARVLSGLAAAIAGRVLPKGGAVAAVAAPVEPTHPALLKWRTKIHGDAESGADVTAPDGHR